MNQNQPTPGATQAIDPVCGMIVDVATTPHKANHGGETHYFCAASCRTKFMRDPSRYLDPDRVAAAAANQDKDAIHTCPMHPEVRQVGAGSCPLCGMALEPETVSLESGPNPELAEMTRRFWISLVLTLPVFVLEMGSHVFGHVPFAAPQHADLVQMLLATPVVLWGGWPFFERGWQSLKTLNLNMFTLISMGTGVAWAYSMFATLLPGILPRATQDVHGATAVYFEAAAVITVLVLLGQVLELRARDRTSSALRALLDLSPRTAHRLHEGSEEDVPVDQVMAGDLLRVKPGESVPVDGVIVDGESTLDESMVTGESLPQSRFPGDKVTGGTRNTSGSFVMRAEKVGRETMLARIVQMVADAQRSRAPVQRLADQVSRWFVPVVIVIAIAAFAAWYVFGPEPRFALALTAAVAVLIIACPCALGLATPMSVMVGIGRGAQAGVLVRSAEALERLEKAGTLIFDKTGTLTEGRPKVISADAIADADENEVLRLAASVEQGSEHPIARAIVNEAKAHGLPVPRVMGFDATAGKGAIGMVERKRLAIGTAEFLNGLSIDVSPGLHLAEKARAAGGTVVFVAINGKVAGVIAVADAIKQTAPQALQELRDLGLRIVMLTGDHAVTAQAIAGKLGISDVQAGMLPDGKLDYVKKLQERGARVAFAGDGVNDAPALAAADIGIAMDSGSDAAIENAGVVLVKGDLAGLVRAIKLSRATMRNIRQNLFLAFAYNAICVPVAAGVLYPVFGILLTPVLAAAAMSLSSVSVIANALRLRAMRL
jgi:Cu+-exporting ATPase